MLRVQLCMFMDDFHGSYFFVCFWVSFLSLGTIDSFLGNYTYFFGFVFCFFNVFSFFGSIIKLVLQMKTLFTFPKWSHSDHSLSDHFKSFTILASSPFFFFHFW